MQFLIPVLLVAGSTLVYFSVNGFSAILAPLQTFGSSALMELRQLASRPLPSNASSPPGEVREEDAFSVEDTLLADLLGEMAQLREELKELRAQVAELSAQETRPGSQDTSSE